MNGHIVVSKLYVIFAVQLRGWKYGHFTINVPGIFAAGNARRGQSLVV
ncbi:hypothetical protein [Candidatus Leptofilum sp.]